MSDHSPESFQGYAKRCLTVFGVVMAITLMMVGVHYAHLPVAAGITLTLVAAAVNAALVAGYLMHIVSEKRLTFIVLAFTAVFFVGLMFLTIFASHDIPRVVAH